MCVYLCRNELSLNSASLEFPRLHVFKCNSGHIAYYLVYFNNCQAFVDKNVKPNEEYHITCNV